MRVWRECAFNAKLHEGGITPSLEEWLREALESLPPATISLETNLGGLDEAGIWTPDRDWAGLVAAEFPHHRVEVRYLPPQGPEEARGPYLVRLEIQGTVVLRAEVHVKGPGAWVIYEDP